MHYALQSIRLSSFRTRCGRSEEKKVLPNADPLEIFLFKKNNKDTRTKSMDVAIMCFLLNFHKGNLNQHEKLQQQKIKG